MKKYLTKSRFKLASECPTKLYYTGKSDYANASLSDPFMRALAEGGFQVGELAKAYYPEGNTIKTLDLEQAVATTNELLKQDSVVIFEAAIQVEDFFIRVDILKKTGNSIHLIEVKAKSIDSTDKPPFWNKTLLKNDFYKLTKEWKPYLYDIAFQKFVTALAFPEKNITSSLMLADKSKVATVDGLNQSFMITRDERGRTNATRTNNNDLGEKILAEVNVDFEVNHIINGTDQGKQNRQELELPSFANEVRSWAKAYINNQKIKTTLGKQCKGCEFKTSLTNIKSGFHECWQVPREAQTVLNLWNYRGSDKALATGAKLLTEFPESLINLKESEEGLSQSERQLLQLTKHRNKDLKPYIDYDELGYKMSQWNYPLNFIDFETSMSALPFNAGRRPYEQLAFQFSHHIMHKDGRIEHANQYINTKPGVFPNFEFVRALKKSLSVNDGTIFKFAPHENTVLIQIMDQLKSSEEADKEQLTDWILSVTEKKTDKKTDKKEVLWSGERNMIDLCKLVKKYYYHPQTKGSNSIKAVLPAVLSESLHLQEKYSKPIYGDQIKSLNFKDKVWLKKDNEGKIIDPYKQLKPLDRSDLEASIFNAEVIKDGGGAMTAYAAMQFTQMSNEEREAITAALLKYCELDTLAMVFIVEHWLELLENKMRITG